MGGKGGVIARRSSNRCSFISLSNRLTGFNAVPARLVATLKTPLTLSGE